MLMRSFLTLAVVMAASQAGAWAEPGDFKGKPGYQGAFVAYDNKAGTLVVEHFDKATGAQRVTFVVAKDVKVRVDNDKPAKIEDLLEDTQLDLFLNEDKTTILGIRAEGPTQRTDRLQAVDAEKKTITIKHKNEITFSIAADAKIVIDGRAAKLADVKPNVPTSIKMSVDQKSVVSIAQGTGVVAFEKPGVREGKLGEVVGRVKAVDADKGTITLTVNATKIAPEEDKTFVLAKDAKIVISSQEAKLTDLPAKTVAVTLKDDKVVALRTVDKSAPEAFSLQGVLKAQSGEKNSITVTLSSSKGQPAEDRTFDVDKDAKILIDYAKQVKLADLPLGSQISLSLSKDQKVVGIIAVGPTFAGTVKAVDANKNTVTVTLYAGKGNPGEDRTFDVAKEARIAVDKAKVAKLGDLAAGARITLTLGLDRKSAIAVSASTVRPEASSVVGALTELDAAKDKVTIAVSKGKTQPAENQTYIVPKDAKVLIDLDQPAKLADLKNGAIVTIVLSAEQKVVALRAVGPNLVGVLKSADDAKSILTVAVNAGKNSPGEDKDFNVAKEARFWMGKRQAKLADLAAGVRVTLLMSIDGKQVIGVRAEPQ